MSNKSSSPSPPFIDVAHSVPADSSTHPALDRPDIYETVILCHGRALQGSYPIPPGYHGEFITTRWEGAAKVDVYIIVPDQGGHHEQNE